MKRLLVLTEVYKPETFIINDLVDKLSENYRISVLTRSPSYPHGQIYPGFKNFFSKKEEYGINVFRFPIFLNYNNSLIAKVANLFWQPIAFGVIVHLINWDKIFVYQTGSLYSYSFLWPLRYLKRKSVIWSQDLWPEAGYEFGFPKIYPVTFFLDWLTKFTLGHFDKILVQSDSFKKHYASKYSKDSCTVYNFSNINKSQTYFERKDKSTIIYAGNIGSVQNLDAIIRLFDIIKKSFLPIETLNIYGEGSRFEELRLKHINSKDVIFHGRVPLKKIQMELEKCRYAIFSLTNGPIQKTIPSRLQFFYNNNVPIVYLGRGATKDFIMRSDCGIVIESLNVSPKTILQRFLNFESKDFQTSNLFDKNKIVDEIKEYLE